MSLYKVLVIGDGATGKTAIVDRLINDTFSDDYKANLGCDFELKEMEVFGRNVRVQLWDLAGQYLQGEISPLWCHDANGAILVSDVANKRTIERALNWKEQVDHHVKTPDDKCIPMVLCVNKYDLANSDEAISKDGLEKIVTQNNLAAGFFTSAKNGINVKDALIKLIEEVIVRFGKNYYNEEEKCLQAN